MSREASGGEAVRQGRRSVRRHHVAGGACGALLAVVSACVLPPVAAPPPASAEAAADPAVSSEGETAPVEGVQVGEVVGLSVPLLDCTLWQVQDAEAPRVQRWCVVIGSASDPNFLSALDVVRAPLEGVGVVIVIVDELRDDAERVQVADARVGWDPEGVVPLQLGVSALPSVVIFDSRGAVQWSASLTGAEGLAQRWGELRESVVAE